MTNLIEVIGYIAAILTTASFFPQVYKTIQTKDTSGISLTMYVLFLLGIILWFTYGIMLNSIPIILANGITGILSCVILYYKIMEPKRKNNR